MQPAAETGPENSNPTSMARIPHVVQERCDDPAHSRSAVYMRPFLAHRPALPAARAVSDHLSRLERSQGLPSGVSRGAPIC